LNEARSNGVEDAEMPDFFCEACLADNEARLEVRDRGVVLPRCAICSAEGTRALAVDDPRFKRILRALIRVHFSEWDYNHHVGGESLFDVLFGRNAVFAFVQSASGQDFEAIEDARFATVRRPTRRFGPRVHPRGRRPSVVP